MWFLHLFVDDVQHVHGRQVTISISSGRSRVGINAAIPSEIHYKNASP